MLPYRWRNAVLHLAALPTAYALGRLAYFITGANLGSNGMPPFLLADGIVSILCSRLA